MAERIGITPDIETTKWQAEKDFRNPRNWKLTEAFKSKKEAKAWEKNKTEELDVKSYPQNIDTKRIRAVWQGFYFEHDGPK